MPDEYIAHKNPISGETQTILDHLSETALKTAEFADVFGAAECGRLCGMLHDIGKYSKAFQRRIRGSTESVDHSSAGAIEAFKAGNVPVSFCIAGHHGGLPNLGNRKSDLPEDGTFFAKTSRQIGKDIEDYKSFSSEISISKAKIPEIFAKDTYNAFFFIKMLFSCLVDADFLDTEEFMSGRKSNRGGFEDFDNLVKKLDFLVENWREAKTPLNVIRNEILHTCIEAGQWEKGLFSLSVPTGGGKTISSVAFALHHLNVHGLKRIIYVIPYTSIIEQTQVVFNDIFGEDNVIAHFANVEYDSDAEDYLDNRHRLSAENWDAPIILTTAVQFFESLFANRPSRCRKLHNIANSVIIFDEAQMLPVPYLKPCVYAITQLVDKYGCSAVLCTATQPSLERLFYEFLPDTNIREICKKNYAALDIFRRVNFVTEGVLEDAQLAERLNNENQVLCVVNNRRQAQEVFGMLDKEGSFHLSTMMCPAHRRQKLKEIKELLANKQNKPPCRVVSTSLVEAGVDVDFPTVYRALAGLDSMIQAGGRCNREGKRSADESMVRLFESERRPPEIVKQNIVAAKYAMRQSIDISSPEAVRAYFEFLYYTIKDETALDSKAILIDIKKGLMPFETVAEKFRLIDKFTYNIFIPRDEAVELIEQLRQKGATKNLLRKLGQYAVAVEPWHFAELIRTGAVEKLEGNSAILLDESLYDEDMGLSFTINEGQAMIL